MATLSYLFTNRKKYSVTTLLFYKAWAKRFLTLKELVLRNVRRLFLLRAGASIANTAEIGEALIIGNKSNLTVGHFSFIGKVEIRLRDQVVIGNNVCINDGVKLLTGSHGTADPEWKIVKGSIIINDYCWIATNAIVLPGVEIGYGAVIGAGCVVSKSVPDYCIAVGNPVVIVSKKRATDLRYNPCAFLAANSAWLT